MSGTTLLLLLYAFIVSRWTALLYVLTSFFLIVAIQIFFYLFI